MDVACDIFCPARGDCHWNGHRYETRSGLASHCICCLCSLVLLNFFNQVAPVLLDTLLCGIYATIFGFVVYFCPYLLKLLQPDGGVAVRLLICFILCLLLFAAHTITYGRLVAQPPTLVYWWWQYGILELLPAVIFLVLLRQRRPSLSEHDTTTNEQQKSLLDSQNPLLSPTTVVPTLTHNNNFLKSQIDIIRFIVKVIRRQWNHIPRGDTTLGSTTISIFIVFKFDNHFLDVCTCAIQFPYGMLAILER